MKRGTSPWGSSPAVDPQVILSDVRFNPVVVVSADVGAAVRAQQHVVERRTREDDGVNVPGILKLKWELQDAVAPLHDAEDALRVIGAQIEFGSKT